MVDLPPDPDPRDGEVRLCVDAGEIHDATLAFIGHVGSPWTRRNECPRNRREAREQGGTATLHIAPPFRPALANLELGQWVHLLTWLHLGRRDLAMQRPRHASEARGTFSLRSPVRPNPIGLHLVRIVGLDMAEGRIDIDAIDVLDGTPVLDIKPYLATVDRPSEE